MPLLRVARVESLARTIHGFELRDPMGGELPAFAAGAHVAVTAPNGSVRKYSLCNDPVERDRYVIAVKRDEAGHGGSVSLVDGTRVGDEIEVSEPRNAFELDQKAASYLFIAGGIGITPIMAMVRTAQRLGVPFKLVYLTRSREDTPFVDELRAPGLSPRVTLHHDGGDPSRAFDLWPLLEKPSKAHVYACGPRGLLEGVRDMTGHWTASAVHFESFLDAQAQARPEDRPFTVVLASSGARIEVPPGISVLEAMRAKGFDAPSSCESGTCGTCKTRLLAGEADHRDLVLAEDEKREWIMTCVSRALSSEITIER
ncbi:MAG TPA: PDR/VanB family oxidoreductase [Usitatibacter sp.]|jgi:phthalate 4,5-dioxygenase reductase subunit|nr:PDR/VanB family oxidoreductase [Usitatibacter sp.]